MIATDKAIKKMLLAGASYREIKTELGTGDARVYRLKKQLEKDTGIDLDLLADSLKMHKQLQHQRDYNRVNTKKLREEARLENAVVEIGKNIIEILDKYKLPKSYNCKQTTIKGSSAVVQLSDLHFNELIDLIFNKYDFEIAAKRLQLYAQKLKVYLKAAKVTDILLANTGDLINSDRRMDEILTNATNRSKAVILSVILLEQFIIDLAKDFKITIASIIGNESRMTQDNGWTDIIASDNYDFTLHQMLGKLFEDTNIKFLNMNDSLEKVVSIGGKNILMFHGHQIKHSSLEKTVQNVIGKYIAQGTKIDFVILGDHHSCRIGEYYARSASMCGSNAYSDHALQLAGRASQNIHIIYTDGNIDSVKIDLQNVPEVIKGYDFNKKLEEYHAKSISKAKQELKIEKVLI